MAIFQRFIIFGLLFLTSVACFGQTFGTITGEVKDASGAIVGNAAVTVANTSNNATRTEQTNASGLYNFPSLAPGPYEVRVELAGFKTERRTNIQLQVQQTARVDFALELGKVNESIEVSGAAEQLNTENATVGTVIENKRVVELPLNGRDYLQLVTLSPNVTTGFGVAQQADNRQGGTRSREEFAIAGGRSTSNHYTLDGVENTDVNFNLYLFQPSIDAIQEFKIQSGVYPAGFTLGGPLSIPKVFNAKNKLFFMVNYEGFKQRQTSNGFFNVPTLEMRNGDFSSLLTRLNTQLYYPSGRSQNPDKSYNVVPIPGNKIPVSLIPQQSIQMLKFLPLPNQPIPADGSPLRDFILNANNTVDKDSLTTRIEWRRARNPLGSDAMAGLMNRVSRPASVPTAARCKPMASST